MHFKAFEAKGQHLDRKNWNEAPAKIRHEHITKMYVIQNKIITFLAVVRQSKPPLASP